MKSENEKLHIQINSSNKSLELDNESIQVLSSFFELLIETDIEQRKGEKDA
jgi:hypothetical protein